jgi:hypothetical protein
MMPANQPIAVDYATRVNCGAFADIFKVSSDTVVKLFKRKSLADPPDGPANDPNAAECAVRATWDSECSAYETIVLADLNLVAHYLGRVRVQEVKSSAGTSKGASYCLDCAYLMRLIPGNPTKWGDLSGSMRRQAAVLQQRWAQLGVCHLDDAGVFGDQSIEAVIDFALEDVFDRLQFAFRTDGRLPQEAIDRWGTPITA